MDDFRNAKRIDHMMDITLTLPKRRGRSKKDQKLGFQMMCCMMRGCVKNVGRHQGSPRTTSSVFINLLKEDTVVFYILSYENELCITMVCNNSRYSRGDPELIHDARNS